MSRARKLRDEGKCVTCRTPTEMYRCAKCIVRRAASQHLGSAKRASELEALLSKQQGKCAYTGRPLEIGKNASVDHILPQSRHPEHKADVLNLRWVDASVNKAKSDLSLPDFVRLCRDVLTHCGYTVIRAGEGE